MDKEIIDYQILSSRDYLKIEEEVKERLKLDWQPYGSLVVREFPDYTKYLQVMVRYAFKTVI